MILDIAD